jgi:uncharacterized protein (DUF1330 family)
LGKGIFDLDRSARLGRRLILLSAIDADLTIEKAKAWNATPQLAEINAIRANGAKSRSFVVEGF